MFDIHDPGVNGQNEATPFGENAQAFLDGQRLKPPGLGLRRFLVPAVCDRWSHGIYYIRLDRLWLRA